MSIIKNKRFGVVIRTFATLERDVDFRVEMVKKLVEKIDDIVFDGQKLFSRVDILVWADKKFSESDCGQTAGALRKAIKQPGVKVSVVENGDLYCTLLNYGVVKQLRDRVDYSLIISPEATSYLNPETIQTMLNALENGALVTGLAINELTKSILEGRLCNTFCIWENISLMSVGGFDSIAAKPADLQTTKYVRGWSEHIEDHVHYHLAGTEEMIPLARLVDTFGPCLAPVLPQGPGAKKYQIPDQKTQPELWQRYVAKVGTKIERQSSLLESIGFDPAFLRQGVIQQYQNQMNI